MAEIQTAEDQKSKHPFLKKVLIGCVIIYIIIYISSSYTLSNLQTDTKNLFLSTNNSLLDQGVSIDHVVTSMYGDGNNTFDVKVNNPAGFSSPYLLYTPEIRLNSAYSTDPNAPLIVITSVRIKKPVINYEINNQEINVYKNLDKILSKVSPGPNYSPLTLLTSAQQPATPLNYSGIKFFLGDVIFESPTINVYNNGKLVKKYAPNDLVLKFKSVQQPLTYADALVAGNLQLVTKLDLIVRQ